MSEGISVVVRKANDLKTDDPDLLDQIMDHLNADRRFNYMREDGGSIAVISFLRDKLTLDMEGSCPSCAPIQISGTRLNVKQSLERDFGEITVDFVNVPEPTGPKPTAGTRPATEFVHSPAKIRPAPGG
jgi:Fe-S cluster biogenesis protein NfuA